MSDRKPMNFVIFMPDEMRADAAGCYGHPLAQTPNLDRLASQGTRFDQAFVQHPVCSPSRCSIFTGWYPHVAGHRSLWHLLRPHEPSMMRDLKDAGYDVRMYGKNDLFAAESFPLSVTEFDRPLGTARSRRVAAGPDDPLYDSFLNTAHDGGPWDTADAAAVRRGIEFLRQTHDKPFLLYLPLSFPHPPYCSPQPWHDMYSPDDVPELCPPGLAGKPAYHELIRRTRRLDQLGERDFRKIAAVYLGMISYSDWLLGELMQVLDDTGLSASTCLIHTSDHGDWAGEYGLVEKWSSCLDDALMRVPLVIRTPGGAAAHVVREPVEVFDIMPTILQQAGVEARHAHYARSLTPQLAGAAGDPGRAAFAEAGYDPHDTACFEGRDIGKPGGWTPDMIYYQKGLLQQTHPHSVCRSVMVRTMRHKLVRRTADANELYDIQADPRELNNLYGRPEMQAVQRDLENRLMEFYLSTSDVTPFSEDPRGYPAKPAMAPASR